MPPVTHISRAHPDRVEVRGLSLTDDLMGKVSFTDYFHLLLTGRLPDDDERFFLDLLLVGIAEHGMMPTNVAARMTLAADPNSLQGAVAAGILGAGPVLLGTTEDCARLLAQTHADGEDPRAVAQRIKDAGDKLPGFGHPVHKPLDPRAERILELARERGVAADYTQLAEDFRVAVHETWGKPLTMNISMPMAAVLLDLGFSAQIVKAVPILARTASLLGHLAEEQQESIGFQMAKAAEDLVEYQPE
jgi:citrate synthase